MENNEKISETVNWIKRLFVKNWTIEKICVTRCEREEVAAVIKEVFPQSTYIPSVRPDIAWSLDGRTLIATPIARDEWTFSWSQV